MAEMEWFPFYAQDFLTSRKVRLMSDANVGRYVKLLAESWVHGPLPDDMGAMGAILGLGGDAMAEAWQELRRAFVLTDDGWVNERLEQTRAEQEAKRERYVRAGRKGAKTRWSQEDSSNAIAMPMRSHAGAISSKKENREEEVEEKKEPSAPKKRASQLPDDWKPNDHHAELARAKGVMVGEEAAHFKDHHLAKGSTFKDWDRAFNTWIRNAKKFQRGANPGSQAATVKNERPQASAPRQTQGLEHVSGPPPDRTEEADRWLKQHPEETEEMLRECQEEMAWALANTKREDVAAGMMKAALRRKVLERIDGRAA